MSQGTGGQSLEVVFDQETPITLRGAFACAPGELLALVGPSGAGKTAVLRIVAGLTRPQTGRVAVGDDVWCDTAQGVFQPPQQRRVGLVFQSYALMPHLSAIDNVALPLLHLPRQQRVAEACRWLDHVGLGAAQQARRPAALSGGEQQRVAVARALAREPAVLLLDEPFSAVDQMNRQSLYRLLADMLRDLDIPIVLVTHDLHEARLLADRFVVLDAGRVLQQGSPAAIHRAPRNTRVADLVGIHNRFEGVWVGPALEPGWGLLRWGKEAATAAATPMLLKVRDKSRLSMGQRVHWILPGDGVTVLDHAPQTAEEFGVEVAEARHLGEITLATLALTDVPGAVLRLTLSGAQRAPVVVGATLTVRLDLELVHVMPVRAS